MFKKQLVSFVLSMLMGIGFASALSPQLLGGPSWTMQFCSKISGWNDGIYGQSHKVTFFGIMKAGSPMQMISGLTASYKTDVITITALNTKPITNLPANAVFVISNTTSGAYAAYNINSAKKCVDTLSGTAANNINLLFVIQEDCPKGPIVSCLP